MVAVYVRAMTATHSGGGTTLADVLNRRREALGLSVTEVARRAALPLTTTQRRFQDAKGLTHSELVAIAASLEARPSELYASAEVDEDAARIASDSTA